MASNEDLFQPADTADGTPAADTGADSTAAAPAPARKRARRATKKASAPAAAPAAPASGDATAPSVAAASEAPDSAPAETAGSAPAAAPVDTPVDAAADASVDAAGDTAAPAKRTARKTAVRKTAKKAATKRGSAKPAEAAEDAGASVTDAPHALDTVVQDTEEEEVGAGGPAAGEPAEPVAAVPSFGLLFQPPDPAKAPARKRGAKKAVAAPVEPEPTLAPDDTPEEQAAPRDAAIREVDESSEDVEGGRRRRRRGGKGRGRGRGQGDEGSDSADPDADQPGDTDEQDSADTGPDSEAEDAGSTRRRRRRRRSGSSAESEDPPGTVTRVRESRRDEPQSVKGSTRLEAKKQRRREGRELGRRRTVITEAEFLARRESVDRVMVVREREGRTQIGVLEDNVLVEHYVSRESNASMAGNVYLGRVQNVLPSMEAAFVDIGKGRNAVLYAGEVNWDAAGLENNQPKRIENALKSGDPVLVQVTKDPIGHKGARLTSQISLPGRYLVYVPEGSMTGISRKLPDTERSRLKSILKEVVPDSAGVIVRTAAEGASEQELRADVERLTKTWEKIQQKAESKGKAKGGAPTLVHGEPDLTVRVIRDVFNEDFHKLVVAGEQAWSEVSDYLGDVAPDLAERLERWTAEEDLFTHFRVDEQIAKAMDRKVWLPSGGSLVIDRTEAMTVVDVNTGKFVGSGGNLEETVTKNNIEAAEEIVRQLRLRDIGGIIVIDFIDMVLESNRDLVVRRLLECLGRDRTKHQVAEVTSLGLVQMTRKRVGSGLIEVFSETCEHCGGRGIIVHADPVEKASGADNGGQGAGSQPRTSARAGRRGRSGSGSAPSVPELPAPVHSGPTPAQIAAAAHAAALKSVGEHHADDRVDDHVEHGEHRELGDLHATPDAPAQAVVEALDPDRQQPDTHEVRRDQPADQPGAGAAAQPAPVAVEPVAAPAPKRRKRGRVVAPAGPPRHAAEDGGGTGAQAATEVAEGRTVDAS